MGGGGEWGKKGEREDGEEEEEENIECCEDCHVGGYRGQQVGMHARVECHVTSKPRNLER